MKLTEKNLIRIIREEYTNRLIQYEVAARLMETETVDKRGNILLSKDLKVRHKESGYEYTIDHIDGEGDEMLIYLRNPEVPRVEVPSSPETINELERTEDVSIINVEMPDGESLADNSNQELGDVFAVKAEEFEKEYVVD